MQGERNENAREDTLRMEKEMKKIEITIQVEPEGFVIEKIKPLSQKNMLLKNLKNNERKDE